MSYFLKINKKYKFFLKARAEKPKLTEANLLSNGVEILWETSDYGGLILKKLVYQWSNSTNEIFELSEEGESMLKNS